MQTYFWASGRWIFHRAFWGLEAVEKRKGTRNQVEKRMRGRGRPVPALFCSLHCRLKENAQDKDMCPIASAGKYRWRVWQIHERFIIGCFQSEWAKKKSLLRLRGACCASQSKGMLCLSKWLKSGEAIFVFYDAVKNTIKTWGSTVHRVFQTKEVASENNRFPKSKETHNNNSQIILQQTHYF